MRLLLAFSFVLGMSELAPGAPVLGNLAQPVRDGEVPVTLNAWQASSIRLSPDTSSWSVNSVTLRLSQTVPNQYLSLRITGETAFRPDLTDTRVLFENPIAIGSGPQNVTFTASVSPSPVLQPGQTYWLVLGVEALDSESTSGTGLYFWSYTLNSQSDSIPVDGWEFGASTASAGTGGIGWSPEPTTPFAFVVDAVPFGAAPMTLARWRSTHPGGPVDEATFLTSNEDGDEMNGLMEYAFDGSAEGMPRAIVGSSGQLGMEYTRWRQAPDLEWLIEVSEDFDFWKTIDATDAAFAVTLVSSEQERVRVFLLGKYDRVFLRLRVNRL